MVKSPAIKCDLFYVVSHNTVTYTCWYVNYLSVLENNCVFISKFCNLHSVTRQHISVAMITRLLQYRVMQAVHRLGHPAKSAKIKTKSNQIKIGKEVKGQLYKQYIIRHTASFNCYFCQNLNANIYFCKQCLFFTRWTISAIHNMNAYRELTIWCTYKVHMSFEIQSA